MWISDRSTSSPVKVRSISEPGLQTVNEADAADDFLDVHPIPKVCWDQANQRWQTDGITWLAHDSENHQLTYSINHLTEFALMAQSDPDYQISIPVILK